MAMRKGRLIWMQQQAKNDADHIMSFISQRLGLSSDEIQNETPQAGQSNDITE